MYYTNTHTHTWARTLPWGSNHVQTSTAQHVMRRTAVARVHGTCMMQDAVPTMKATSAKPMGLL